jgi:hypothetical protein
VNQNPTVASPDKHIVTSLGARNDGENFTTQWVSLAYFPKQLGGKLLDLSMLQLVRIAQVSPGVIQDQLVRHADILTAAMGSCHSMDTRAYRLQRLSCFSASVRMIS